MRRRRPRTRDGEVLSERLLTFNPADWPQAAEESDTEFELAVQYPELGNSPAWRRAWVETRAFEMWLQAQRAWAAAGGIWPGGEEQREFVECWQMPDAPWDPTAI